MPEAFMEAEQLHGEIERLRPEWLVEKPDTREWHANCADWRNGFWWRARTQSEQVSKIISALDDGRLDRARDEAKVERAEAKELGHTADSLQLDDARAWFLHSTPGWDGEPFEAWRGSSMSNWWRTLIMGGSKTMLDWLAPWLDLHRIRREHDSWVTFWTRECATERLPREWLRWAMSVVQTVKDWSPGAPVDNQISTYLVDYDFFVTADKVFAKCIDLIRPHAPVALAEVSFFSPKNGAAGDHMLGLLNNVGNHS
jgi:hypothetical protein